jgi:hypothetical protein
LTKGCLSRLLRAQDVTRKLASRTLRRANVAHAGLRRPLGGELGLTDIPLPGKNNARNLPSKLLRRAASLPKLCHSSPGCAQSKLLRASQGTLPRRYRARDLLP